MPTTRKDSMTATTNPAAAFRDKLLDRLPIYTATGREIAALTSPTRAARTRSRSSTSRCADGS